MRRVSPTTASEPQLDSISYEMATHPSTNIVFTCLNHTINTIPLNKTKSLHSHSHAITDGLPDYDLQLIRVMIYNLSDNS